MIGTKRPEDEHYMNINALGNFHIEVTPTDAGVMTVTIGAETRKDPIQMMTNRDETVDQFATRVRSMLRALINGEVREAEPQAPDKKKKGKSWPEQKEEMKANV